MLTAHSPDYMMVGVFPVLFLGWKVIKRTKWLQPHEVDLISGVEEIEEYTRNFIPSPSRWVMVLSESLVNTLTSYRTRMGKALDKLFG